MFQIVELTENKMRLMCPLASALMGESNIVKSTSGLSKDSKWYYFAANFAEGRADALSRTKDAWGLSKAYERLKALDNAFPDDFRDALSVVARPLTSWTISSITNASVFKYDEDMRVRQVTDDIFKKGTLDDTDPTCLVPTGITSYYPTSVNEFTHYLTLPEDKDNYEERKNLVSSWFGKLYFFDYKPEKIEIQYKVFEYRIKRTYMDSPYASCYFEKGITTNGEYNKYTASGVTKNDYDYNLPQAYGLFPEVVIEAN
jgi:hypothetical protein